ncbi:Wzz/FepE/Etk N-terminal domain-containing protein [uncultured Tateyamaria sp.]|uniref:GumC family protein n=1 Tax=uncultured Tateyamaria sp. TaxID=455651 RepID=UPI00262BD11F|nr:Wzz/FepE/Etk N-terminal domain-containing protein [uncultured Tateyamaria sp.]
MTLPLRFYWMLLLRRMPLMMVLVLLCSGIAVFAAFTLPPVYSSMARLQVEAPKITIELGRNVVETEAAEQLQVIEEQLLTRANLLDIAQKYGVFDDIGDMTPDRIVGAMREATSIRRSSGSNQATLMSISFTASRGQVAAEVVNDYVTLVLEANSSFRRERVENTVSFFAQETDRLADEIDAQSNRIIAFKNANVEALPEDLLYRQDRQSTLQERLSRLEQERASIVSNRSEMIAVFEATGRLGVTARRELSPEERRLQDLELELAEARTIYSDTNPRLIQLVGQIEQLERSIAGAGPRDDEDPENAEPSFLDLQLAEMNQRVQEIDLEIVRINDELEQLARAITATATNSITLERLERDLESIRTRYNTSVNNLNQARMAERVEVNAQGQRISLIEGAVVPQEPSGPPRMKIAVAGVGGGMMLAVGLFVLFELLNQKIRHPNELQSRFNIIPIGVVPYLEARGERIRRRLYKLAAILAAIALVPAGLYYLHTEIMPLEIVANKILGRLGLM